MNLLIFLGLFAPAASRHAGVFIIGGTDADIADHPHQLSLRYLGSHSCGASLISTTRAVSAAHCAGSSVSSYSLLGGTSDRTVTDCVTCVLITPTSFIRHPNFVNSGAQGYPNDVAVLSFEPVTANVNLSPVTMATTADGSFAGESCVITGWGKTGIATPLPTILQQATVTVVTSAACEASWGPTINQGNICASSPTATSCGGDDGGPMVCRGLLAGILSYGGSSCSLSYPLVATSVSYFYNWITAQ